MTKRMLTVLTLTLAIPHVRYAFSASAVATPPIPAPPSVSPIVMPRRLGTPISAASASTATGAGAPAGAGTGAGAATGFGTGSGAGAGTGGTQHTPYVHILSDTARMATLKGNLRSASADRSFGTALITNLDTNSDLDAALRCLLKDNDVNKLEDCIKAFLLIAIELARLNPTAALRDSSSFQAEVNGIVYHTTNPARGRLQAFMPIKEFIAKAIAVSSMIPIAKFKTGYLEKIWMLILTSPRIKDFTTIKGHTFTFKEHTYLAKNTRAYLLQKLIDDSDGALSRYHRTTTEWLDTTTTPHTTYPLYANAEGIITIYLALKYANSYQPIIQSIRTIVADEMPLFKSLRRITTLSNVFDTVRDSVTGIGKGIISFSPKPGIGEGVASIAGGIAVALRHATDYHLTRKTDEVKETLRKREGWGAWINNAHRRISRTKIHPSTIAGTTYDVWKNLTTIALLSACPASNAAAYLEGATEDRTLQVGYLTTFWGDQQDDVQTFETVKDVMFNETYPMELASYAQEGIEWPLGIQWLTLPTILNSPTQLHAFAKWFAYCSHRPALYLEQSQLIGTDGKQTEQMVLLKKIIEKTPNGFTLFINIHDDTTGNSLHHALQEIITDRWKHTCFVILISIDTNEDNNKALADKLAPYIVRKMHPKRRPGFQDRSTEPADIYMYYFLKNLLTHLEAMQPGKRLRLTGLANGRLLTRPSRVPTHP